ncbi:MAG: cytochrome c oxidase assembly protein [Deinococcales bacterium]|nr:cytochrome c oxidase assembly protein [Deinococcales bacterium]
MLYLSWQLEPVLLGLIVTLSVAFYLSIGPLRSRLAPGEPYPTRHAIFFGIGLVLLFLNEGSPLHDLAERYLLSAHMVQHLALSYIVAPILLLSTPAWLLRAALAGPRVLPITRVLLSPLVCFLAFTLVMSLYHLPRIYDLSLVNTSLHHGIHIVLLLVSFMVWWPIMSPLEELPRPPYIIRCAYLFLQPVSQLPVFAFITFSPEPLYQVYANVPTRAFGMSVIEDQALGGAIMNVGGELAFGIPFIVVFFNWYRNELRPRRPGAEGAQA